MFQRKNKGALAGQFDATLDDLDDNGNAKPKESKKVSAAEGGREFINLGASAKIRRPEEPKEEKKEPAQRPRFFGKMNLKNTGDAGEQDTNVKHDYDFKVTYKSQNQQDEENKETKESKEPREPKEQRKPKFKNEKKGVDFNEFEKKKRATGDADGFEVITNDKQRRRPKRANNESSDEEGFAKVK